MAHAQACRWDDIGALQPIREFLGGVVESALRIFGPASSARKLSLTNEANKLLAQVHNFFEEQKLSTQQRVSVRDYVSKHSQWIGSYIAVAHVEEESLRYLQFTLCAVPAVQHRTMDPRGNPADVPAQCVCDLPVVLKVCKRKGKGAQSNVGRQFWCCSEASALVTQLQGSFASLGCCSVFVFDAHGPRVRSGCALPGSEDGCDFFRWCDEPASLGPLRQDLSDLVDERHAVDTKAGVRSVQRALVKFTEAAFFLNVIAFETEMRLQTKQSQEIFCSGDVLECKVCGEPMTSTERLLAEVMRALPDEQEVTLSALRNSARLGRAAMGPRHLSAAQFDEVCELARGLGIADVHQRRAGGAAGRQQRVLAKRVLTEETKRAMENLRVPLWCFPAA